MKQALKLVDHSLYNRLFSFNKVVYRRLKDNTVNCYSPIGAQSLTCNLPRISILMMMMMMMMIMMIMMMRTLVMMVAMRIPTTMMIMVMMMMMNYDR